MARELLKFCKDSLAKEIARALDPYPAWRRPCPPAPENQGGYPYGRRDEAPVLLELAKFMADPTAREHPIRRREEERIVVENFIKHHFLDLDCLTLRQGTPHTLLCSKDDRSYQHLLEWRKKDEAMLRKLEAL